MQTEAYMVTKDRLLVPVDAGEMSDEWFQDNTVRWIKIASPTPDEVENTLRPLELHSHIVQACATPQPPQVEVLEHVLFMSMPLWTPGNSAKTTLRFTCVATTLITIQDCPIDFVDEIVKRFREDQHLLDVSTAALTYQLVEAMLKSLVPPYLALRDDVETAAEVLEQTPKRVETDDILSLKRRATRLSHLLEDYLYCLRELRDARSNTLDIASLRAGFHDLVEDVQRGQKLTCRMEDCIRDLRQSCQNYLQESTNRRLSVLAILSAIYLPSTLIAGIFGMNFDNMPILHMHYGYVAVLLIMVSLVFGQLCFFYRRGWFK